MSEKHFIAPSNSGSSRRMLRRNSAPSTENLASLEESFADLKQTSSTRLPLHSPSTAASVSLQAARTHQHRLNAAQEQRTYHDSCQRLLTHISSVLSVCEELRNVNKNRFPMQYPVLRHAPARQILDAQADARLETASQPEFSSIIQQTKTHFNEFETAREFSILNLDVKVGHASTDLSTLEKQSIANLLDDKLSSCQRHLDNLRARVADTSSKVLVTGDLNSGKSTFVNALLKRELLPVDQQPCTSMFCEVLDANLNNGVEQVHAIPNVEKYNRLDPSTYHVIEMRHLYKVVTEQNDEYKMLKVYARDSRSAQESLLHNGVVDIALIDSPGLNTDSLKTTAVFARQEEIDVVVFVVSAENHFTLSGKEFLWNAANEKTHIFIVVNRFDSIRDKDRCKRLVLEQIRQLSPATYADADDLVHFVSAGTVDLEPGAHKIDAPEFARLEQRLRAFVLENRTKSKLLPAKNYMSNLLKDIECLSELNRASAARELEMASCALKSELPAYENLLRLRDRLLHQVEKMADNATTQVEKDTIKRLNLAVEQIDSTVSNIEYPGVFLIWQYAQDLADSMSRRLLKEVRLAENYARQETQNSLDRIHQLGIENLGNYPLCANVDKMLLKNRDRTVVIQVEPSDFFDLVLDEKLSGCMLSLGAAAAFGSRMIGFKDAMSSLWSVSTSMGAQNMRRLLVPMLSIAGAGFLLYVISDMRYAVERKLVKKFKASVRDSSYVDAQGRRMARESRKVLRVEGYEIQSRIQKEIEKMEQRRGKMQAIVETSEESIKFFAALLEKSGLLLDKVSSVHIDGYTHQKTLRAP